MMQWIKKILWFSLLIFSLGFVVLVLLPLPAPVAANCERVNGTVEEIYSGGVNDAVFRLKDDPVVYYINRGLENGFELTALQTQLNQQEVTIYYIKHWTPLDRKGHVKHIARLEHGDEVIYNEMKEVKDVLGTTDRY